MLPKRILIIDDNDDFSKAVKLNLEILDDTYLVQRCSNGKDGIKKAQEFKPNVILLDVMMPEMDGFETLKRLKDDKNTAHIPVIMLTALDDDVSQERGAELFHELYLTKPIESMYLKEKIDEVFSRHPGD